MILTNEDKENIHEEENAKLDNAKQAKFMKGISQVKARFAKKQLLMVAAMLTLLLGSVAWYVNWIHSPEYSLHQAIEAVRKRDVAKFQKYVEMDTVTSSLFDQAVEIYFAKNTDPNTSWANGIAQGFILMIKPQIIGKFKQSILEGIADGKINGDSISTEGSPFEKLKEMRISTEDSESLPFHFVNIAYSKKEGKKAIVGNRIFLERYNSDDFILDVSMYEMDGYWQVNDIDAKGFYNQIDVQETKMITEKNRAILYRLAKSLQFKSAIQVKRGSNDGWGFSKVVRASFPIKNISNKEIDSYSIAVTVTDATGKLIAELPYTEEANLKPDTQKIITVDKEINPFISTDVELFDMDSSAYQATVKEIKFLDGSIVKPYQMYGPL